MFYQAFVFYSTTTIFPPWVRETIIDFTHDNEHIVLLEKGTTNSKYYTLIVMDSLPLEKFLVELHELLNSFSYDLHAPVFCFISKYFPIEYPYEMAFYDVEENGLLHEHKKIITTFSQVLLSDMLKESKPDTCISNFLHMEELSEQQIQILETLCLVNGNVSATAQILYMHRNTVMYQLRHIISITGLDIRKASDMALFQFYFCCSS